MTISAAMSITDLRPTLLARLRPFQSTAFRHGPHPHAGPLLSYCSLDRERLSAISIDEPLLSIVLRGRKELWQGDLAEVLTPGMAFALPRGLVLDVVNIPDDRSGIYQSLILSVPALPPAIRPLAPAARIDGFAITLTPDLVESICHAAVAVADKGQSQALAGLRLTELLWLLQADPAGRHLMAGDLVQRARWLIAAQPDRAWSVDLLAADLGTGASTLRRKLTAAGWPFRALLAEVRIQVAHRAIGAGASVTQAAEAVGYRSRSHFTQAYRAVFGQTPGGRVIDGERMENARAG